MNSADDELIDLDVSQRALKDVELAEFPTATERARRDAPAIGVAVI
jgi:alpha-D-ribose 1-methylphosphonate 5-triphosphate diphosphatase PhnM